MMKCCVLLSTYNGKLYIYDQLQSILSQTRKVDAVFISDDCSTDNTYEIVTNFIVDNNLTNWHVQRNEKNVGWRKNFANLILFCDDRYDIAFLCDQDDIWKTNKVEATMKCFEEQSSFDLLVSDLELFYEDKKIKRVYIPWLGKKELSLIKIKPNYIDICRPGCVFAVKTKFAKELYQSNDLTSFAHDKILWMYAISSNRLGYINQKLIKYRRYGSATTTIDKKKNRFIHKQNDSKEMISYLSMVMSSLNKHSKEMYMFEEALKMEQLRQKFFSTRNVLYWLQCIKYINYYHRKIMWLGDLFFSITYIK